jgi:uncharacterized RDD family membrane protein YckC
MTTTNVKYAGFWIRIWASILDSIFIFALVTPFMVFIYGSEYWSGDKIVYGWWDVILGYILPVVLIITFWVYRSATPGKSLAKISIIDVYTGKPPSKKQCIIRYLGYFAALLPLGLGIVWVAFDKKKQGWHDKIAGTAVVYEQ